MKRALLAAAIIACALPARGQVSFQDGASFNLSGQLLLSYAGSWSPAGVQLIQSHQLNEGFSAQLSGWLGDSRYIKFRSFALVLHLDQLRPHRSGPFSLGYGTSLRLFSRSIVPVTLSASRGLTLPGSTSEAVQSATTTSLAGTAQLASPLLPKLELQAQRSISEIPDQPRFVSDFISGAVHGESSLHRYAGLATWSAQRTGNEQAGGNLVASIADELRPGRDTSAHLQASVAQGRGLGGADDPGFTGYQTSASLLSRLNSSTVLRTAYSFSGAGASDRDQVTNSLSSGATIDLRPIPLLLGEGAAATYSTIVAPGVKRTLATVSGAQGIATFGGAGRFQYSFGLTGQAGYSQVSDGRPGLLLGASASASGQADWPVFPLRGAAAYSLREDDSSAGQSSRSLNASLSTRYASSRLLLLPAFTYSQLARSDPSRSGTMLETSAANLLVSGATPLWRSQLTFSTGWSEGWSNEPGSAASGSVFARASSAFTFGQGTFGNIAADTTHTLGGGTSASLLASGVWTFREASLSLNYVYNRAWPSDGGGTHSVSVLFSRSMRTSFLPEHR